jgi:hypothetical protein
MTRPTVAVVDRARRHLSRSVAFRQHHSFSARILARSRTSKTACFSSQFLGPAYRATLGRHQLCICLSFGFAPRVSLLFVPTLRLRGLVHLPRFRYACCSWHRPVDVVDRIAFLPLGRIADSQDAERRFSPMGANGRRLGAIGPMEFDRGSGPEPPPIGSSVRRGPGFAAGIGGMCCRSPATRKPVKSAAPLRIRNFPKIPARPEAVGATIYKERTSYDLSSLLDEWVRKSDAIDLANFVGVHG